MFNRPKEALDSVNRAVTETISMIGNDDFEWASWSQTWGNTSCGFGGISGQAFTEAQTVVCSPKSETRVYVFHAGRFAYLIEKPTAEFWELCGARRLPGKADVVDRNRLEQI